MPKKALILDLDNTIYSVSSIAGELFAPLFALLSKSGEVDGRFDAIKYDLMRKPYQWVAQKFCFSERLTQDGLQLLKTSSYKGVIKPFPDYAEIRRLPLAKFLVTSGFKEMQQSKIDGMNIADDFAEIHIVNVETSSKKEVFADILYRHQFSKEDVLVIGDDPDSEIKAAQDLGIDFVLYDPQQNLTVNGLPRITHYGQLTAFL